MTPNGIDANVNHDDLYSFYLSLIVPKHKVKTFKQALEAHNLLDKSLKIVPFDPKYDEFAAKPKHSIHASHGTNLISQDGTAEHNNHPVIHSSQPQSPDSCEQKYVIPTNSEIPNASHQNDEIKAAKARDALLSVVGLPSHPGIEALLSLRMRSSSRINKSNESLLAQAVREWLHSLPPCIRSRLPANFNSLINVSKWTYSIYQPMLLLPPTFLSIDPWPELLAKVLNSHLPALYSTVCHQLKVTHIAINGPIPALLSCPADDTLVSNNTLRSPSNLVALHGDFGVAGLPATDQNFRDAFWVSVVQNDITQVWAPLYTMFSRGNISEKLRLLKLASRVSSSSKGGFLSEAEDSSAVDLYAGIGYFAFSYAKAGVSKVLCWELSGWSIEGLRRGAKKNDWTVKVIENVQNGDMLRDDSQDEASTENQRFLVFHETNTNAADRVRVLRGKIPPVRHVNCGYLPSSSDSWAVAIQVLDPIQGGWIHAHENVAIKDIAHRKHEIVDTFRSLLHVHDIRKSTTCLSIECQHVEQVKAYAPGIVHCVFDIAVSFDVG